MSRRRVESIANLYAALRARDLPALTALLHPQVVIRQSAELPWGGEFNGPAGFSRFFQGVLAALDSEVEIQRLIDSGDTVVAVGITRGIVRATGSSFKAGLAHVYRFDGDLIAESTVYVDQPELLTALARL